MKWWIKNNDGKITEFNGLNERQKLEAANPFCAACKEEFCCVSNDGTCAMIRRYLRAFKNRKVARVDDWDKKEVGPISTASNTYRLMDGDPVGTVEEIIEKVKRKTDAS